MIQSAPKTTSVTLKNGRVLVLGEISLFDLADGEKILGRSHETWFEPIAAPTPEEPDRVITKVPEDPIRTCACMLWLLSRKSGLSRAEVLARKWKFSLDELMLDLVPEDMVNLGPVMVGHFSARGSRPGDGDGGVPGP